MPADTPDVETGSGVFRRTRLAAGGPRRPRGPRAVTNPRRTAVGRSSPGVQPALPASLPRFLRRPSGASEGGGAHCTYVANGPPFRSLSPQMGGGP